MRSNHNITFHGKTQTITEWAEQYGIPNTVVFGRIQIGWDIERALTTRILDIRNMLTHNKKTMSQSDWCRKLGIEKTTLTARLKAGWTVERALSTPVRRKLTSLT